MCCVEADRARQLKLDELSLQQKENLSAVSQLMAQIQELRDKVTLNNAKEFHDPETASGSGLSQVPSQPTRIPSRVLTCPWQESSTGGRCSFGMWRRRPGRNEPAADRRTGGKSSLGKIDGNELCTAQRNTVRANCLLDDPSGFGDRFTTAHGHVMECMRDLGERPQHEDDFPDADITGQDEPPVDSSSTSRKTKRQNPAVKNIWMWNPKRQDE